MRVGQGFDVHRLVAGRPLWLGGVKIEDERGLEGHSDGDVLLHAVADAILGALGEGDLGRHFPSSDPRFKGVESRKILGEVATLLGSRGLGVENLDVTVIAEAPRLAPFQEAMWQSLAEILNVDAARINLKITSTDGLGAIGRSEGIAAQAIVLIDGD